MGINAVLRRDCRGNHPGKKKGRVGSPLGNGPGSVVDVPGPGERLCLQTRLAFGFIGSVWLLSYMTCSCLAVE
jgi:hypothetical protein